MRSLVRNVLYARLFAVSSSFSILAAYPFAAPANVAECARIVYMQAFSLGRPEYSFSLHTHTRKKLCIVYASNIHATFRSSSVPFYFPGLFSRFASTICIVRLVFSALCVRQDQLLFVSYITIWYEALIAASAHHFSSISRTKRGRKRIAGSRSDSEKTPADFRTKCSRNGAAKAGKKHSISHTRFRRHYKFQFDCKYGALQCRREISCLSCGLRGYLLIISLFERVECALARAPTLSLLIITSH